VFRGRRLMAARASRLCVCQLIGQCSVPQASTDNKTALSQFQQREFEAFLQVPVHNVYYTCICWPSLKRFELLPGARRTTRTRGGGTSWSAWRSPPGRCAASVSLLGLLHQLATRQLSDQRVWA
jgi:hypothetical protein